ncbi:MAG: T9SS type A sorting domain-containing protein [Bacteroidota bacterium]|nr:T9SS type A sorting domain-containing protein [Bacteroidota bacterium]MDP4233980.1 T9SS type A sorting domain-containing protein [Bacteroidota bacterium]MDP4242769.1 T9SS type A sorting domain-containing protein [Bacteroidota bacterium]MDP4288483.1 T9SS type A sorting domain-containing protein [Bacteroidota bacterium]
MPFTDSHGATVIATAMAKGDNDNTSTTFAPMAGVAYNAAGIGTGDGASGALLLDIDGKMDNVWTRPVVLNESYRWYKDNDNKTAMNDGIVVVASAVNARVQRALLAMIDTVYDTTGGAHNPSNPFAHPAETIAQIGPSTVRVHPNPATGNQVLICVDSLPAGVPFLAEVVDATGAHVATLYEATPDADLGLCYRLDCTSLPNGTYYVRVSNKTQGGTMKFSVVR